LKKYQSLILDDEGGYFIILRNTLFVKILQDESVIMPFMYSEEEEQEVRRLIAEFRKEFVEDETVVSSKVSRNQRIDDL